MIFKKLFFRAKSFAYSNAEAPLSVFGVSFSLLIDFLRGEKGHLLFRLGLHDKDKNISILVRFLRLNNIKNIFCPEGSIMEGLMEFASSVPEFRRTNKGNIRHRLADIIIPIVLGRASKCAGRGEIIEFGRHNIKRFRTMGMLRNGVPSESTLCRVEQGIDDLCLADRMTDFAAGFRKELFRPDNRPEIVCVDGKAVRGTVQENGRNPDIVSAYSSDTGITLACREKAMR